MPDVIEVPIDSVIRNMGLYPRTFVDETTVQRLVDAMDAGEKLPPLQVNQKNWLIDGFHRWEAHRKKGHKRVPVVRVKTVSDADFFRRAVEANSAHGRPMLGADQARVIARSLELGLEPQVVAKALRVPSVRLGELRTVSIPAAKGDTPNGDDPDARPGLRVDDDVPIAQEPEKKAPRSSKQPRLPSAGSSTAKAWGKHVFYARELRAVIEAGKVEWARLDVQMAFRGLRDVLNEHDAELADSAAGDA